jgi:hypothetical protein
MSAASRSIQSTAPGFRPLGTTLAALAVTAVAVVAIALGQLAASRPAVEPAAGFAPSIHDNGWAKAHAPGAATAGKPVAHDHGWSSTSSGSAAAPVTFEPVGGSGGSTRGRLPQ